MLLGDQQGLWLALTEALGSQRTGERRRLGLLANVLAREKCKYQAFERDQKKEGSADK
jgi:hypothetical protein